MKFWFSQSEAFLINPSFLNLTTAYRSIFDIKLHDEHLFRQFYGSILSPKRRKVPRSVTSTTIYPNRKDQMPARFHLLNTVVNTFDLSKSSVAEKKSSLNLLESWISSIQISESLRQKSKFILPVKWVTVILKNAQKYIWLSVTNYHFILNHCGWACPGIVRLGGVSTQLRIFLEAGRPGWNLSHDRILWPS